MSQNSLAMTLTTERAHACGARTDAPHLCKAKNDRVDRPILLDIYSGIGGLSLGAARAGFNVVGAIDRDDIAIAIHALNFPRTAHINRDVSLLHGDDILRDFNLSPGSIAGLIGGPPCQGFSEIGKKKIDDPRNRLFIDFFRLVSELKPTFFLVENVPGILAERFAPTLRAAFAHVDHDYEIVDPFKVKASEYGAPTSRTRVFIIGYDPKRVGQIRISDFKPFQSAERVEVKDALEGLPQVRSTWQSELDSWRTVKAPRPTWFGSRLSSCIPRGVGNLHAIAVYRKWRLVSGFLGTAHTKKTIRRLTALKPGERDPVSKAIRLEIRGLCPTLRAGTGPDRGSYQAVRPIHPTSPRVISPREAARLQGFPDWFVLHPTKWHSFRHIGNSVSPIVAEQLLAPLRNAIDIGSSAK
jgi:DNA (cytosine-5)-methyltransferase 1